VHFGADTELYADNIRAAVTQQPGLKRLKVLHGRDCQGVTVLLANEYGTRSLQLLSAIGRYGIACKESLDLRSKGRLQLVVSGEEKVDRAPYTGVKQEEVARFNGERWYAVDHPVCDDGYDVRPHAPNRCRPLKVRDHWTSLTVKDPFFALQSHLDCTVSNIFEARIICILFGIGARIGGPRTFFFPEVRILCILFGIGAHIGGLHVIFFAPWCQDFTKLTKKQSIDFFYKKKQS
jgi:hypothetical protein